MTAPTDGEPPGSPSGQGPGPSPATSPPRPAARRGAEPPTGPRPGELPPDPGDWGAPQRAWMGDTQVYLSLYPPPPPRPQAPDTTGDAWASDGTSDPGTPAPSLTQQVDDRMERVGRNSAVQAVGTLASRVLGFVRAALLVWALGGMSFSNDSFTLANTMPNQIFILIGSGVLTAVLIPQITKAMHRDDGGTDFIDRLLTLALIGLVVVTAICLVAVPAITSFLVNTNVFQAGATSAAAVAGYYRLTLLFCYWFMPQIFFYGLFAVLGNVLNARGHFRAAAWAPTWANLVQIAGVLVFMRMWHAQPDPSVWTPAMVAVLGGATTLGIAVQALCLIIPLHRDGFTFRPRFGWRGYGFASVSRLVGWTLATNAASQIVGIYAGKMMAAVRGDLADVAGPASQANAFLLFMLPHSLITVSIITSLFPMLASAWQAGDQTRLQTLVRRFLAEPAVFVIPASAALIALGSPIIRTVFLSIKGPEINNVWLVLSVYAVGLVFFGVGSSAMRYYYAIEAGRTYFWFNGIVPVLQLVACFAALRFVPAFWGVPLICAASTVGWIIQAIIFMVWTRRQIGDYDLSGVLWLWLRLAFASIVAGGVAFLLVLALDVVNQARAFQPVTLLASGVCFCLVFWGLARILHITEFTELVRGAVRRLTARTHAPAAERPA